MKHYLEKVAHKQVERVKLIEAPNADKMLLYTPLIKWYLAQGLCLEAIYSSIQYQQNKIFEWFVDQVTEARRTGVKKKSSLADANKLIDNSAYGKLIGTLKKLADVICTKEKLINVKF